MAAKDGQMGGAAEGRQSGRRGWAAARRGGGRRRRTRVPGGPWASPRPLGWRGGWCGSLAGVRARASNRGRARRPRAVDGIAGCPGCIYGCPWAPLRPGCGRPGSIDPRGLSWKVVWLTVEHPLDIYYISPPGDPYRTGPGGHPDAASQLPDGLHAGRWRYHGCWPPQRGFSRGSRRLTELTETPGHPGPQAPTAALEAQGTWHTAAHGARGRAPPAFNAALALRGQGIPRPTGPGGASAPKPQPARSVSPHGPQGPFRPG